LRFIEEQASLQHCAGDDPAPWADLAHALVNVKEFIFLR
jgi:hypothetical protein